MVNVYLHIYLRIYQLHNQLHWLFSDILHFYIMGPIT